MKTAASNKKVRELIQLVREGKLIPRPEFQRRLVWSREDKDHFIDSILRGYPFPEIYFADGDVDLETGQGSQLLVDGLQRVSTIIQYFDADPDLRLLTVPAYRDLTEDQKRSYLQYDVAVRDLGALTREEVIEVFKRLNATKYSLLDIEVNNALYAGALKSFCETVAEYEFFEKHSTFRASDYKRMGDLRYALTIVGTMLQGYFNRDDIFESLLSRYNDDFNDKDEIKGRLERTLAYVDECGFNPKSRVWKKGDLFTLIIELDQLINIEQRTLSPADTVDRLESFYVQVDQIGLDGDTLHSVYYKAALQASNDRINRIRRGKIIHNMILGVGEEITLAELRDAGL
ncbi:DUF262 domain-containing protein [Aeromonas hydrophila]|uniref:DUF262 domain-containing protein n=1 Tax=Aeromonas hydrophila TaxID=644 RepID=UPI002B482697|nr:DUF262 domain-containing protein [Aeromonas hydrophila]